jgi:hypothetical protein
VEGCLTRELQQACERGLDCVLIVHPVSNLRMAQALG